MILLALNQIMATVLSKDKSLLKESYEPLNLCLHCFYMYECISCTYACKHVDTFWLCTHIIALQAHQLAWVVTKSLFWVLVPS